MQRTVENEGAQYMAPRHSSPSQSLRRCDSKQHMSNDINGSSGADMSGFHLTATSSSNDQQHINYDIRYHELQSTADSHSYSAATLGPSLSASAPRHVQQMFVPVTQMYHPTTTWPQMYYDDPSLPSTQQPLLQQQQWAPLVQPNYPLESHIYRQSDLTQPFPSFAEPVDYQHQLPQEAVTSGSSRLTTLRYLSPDAAAYSRPSRATSLTSNTSSVAQSVSQSEDPSISGPGSRSSSPNAIEMLRWGIPNPNDGRWSCAWPGCNSRTTFNRGCDLRKHYKRHTKTLYCRHAGCPQADKGSNGGFSSKKDRARHEASHDPRISCEWEGCPRKFSRQDNMRDHVRRVHKKRA